MKPNKAKKEGNMVTIREAAIELGYVYSRVSALIRAGRIPAIRIGNNWLITRDALETYRSTPHFMGRPRISDTRFVRGA